MWLFAEYEAGWFIVEDEVAILNFFLTLMLLSPLDDDYPSYTLSNPKIYLCNDYHITKLLLLPCGHLVGAARSRLRDLSLPPRCFSGSRAYECFPLDYEEGKIHIYQIMCARARRIAHSRGDVWGRAA